jgi:hypothetical protein
MPNKNLALYSEPSFCSRTEPPKENIAGLDPGAYTLPSTLDKRGVPLLGKSKTRSKEWISKDHLCEFYLRDSPGVGTYYPRDEFRQRSASPGRFAEAARNLNLSKASGDPNGPIYQTQSTLDLSSRSFEKSRRFREKKRSISLGPGEYPVQSTLGSQTTTFYGRISPKVFIAGLDKEYLGRESKGPGKPIPLPTSEGMSFARSERMNAKHDDGPCPGSYNVILNTSELKAVESFRPNPTDITWTKPKTIRPRFDFRLIKQHNTTMWGLN